MTAFDLREYQPSTAYLTHISLSNIVSPFTPRLNDRHTTLAHGHDGWSILASFPPPSMSEIKQSFLCRSVYVPCETGAPPVQKTMNQIDVVYQLAEVSKHSPDKIRLF